MMIAVFKQETDCDLRNFRGFDNIQLDIFIAVNINLAADKTAFNANAGK